MRAYDLCPCEIVVFATRSFRRWFISRFMTVAEAKPTRGRGESGHLTRRTSLYRTSVPEVVSVNVNQNLSLSAIYYGNMTLLAAKCFIYSQSTSVRS